MPPHSIQSLELSKTDASTRVPYEAFGVRFTIESPSARVRSAIDLVYGEMRSQEDSTTDLEVKVELTGDGEESFLVLLGGQDPFRAEGLGSLLHEIDNRLSTAFQHEVPSLYFVHAAALAAGGKVTLLVGDSGAGKSTTAYALAASGMDYLTDELSAIEPGTGRVMPYPRAICLKRLPPAPLSLPAGSLRTERSIHVPARTLPSRVSREALPLERIIFVEFSPCHERVDFRSISQGQAALRLYQGALNPLAHPSLGLDCAVGLVRKAGCFVLRSAGIEETVRAVRGMGHDES